MQHPSQLGEDICYMSFPFSRFSGIWGSAICAQSSSYSHCSLSYSC